MNLPVPLAAGALLGAAVFSLTARGGEGASTSPFRWSATSTLEQSYDTNVYLQSTTPLADRASWVTTLGAALEVSTRPGAERAATIAYAPTWTVFHSEHAEDFLAHRFSTSFRSPLSGGQVNAQASATFIDGPDANIIWSGPGGAPAVGGPGVRDRRDQAVCRASIRSEWTAGKLIVRPLATLYWGDFQTPHFATPGYQNSVDRGDITVGVDVLGSIASKLSTGLGLRVGGQEQARLLGYVEEYDNRYVRLLALLEGSLAPWCSAAFSIGPEFRHYGDQVHASFGDRSLTQLFVDGVVTINATQADSVAFTVRQFQQMSSSGRGAFDDRNVDLAWRHSFSTRAAAALVLHAYNTKFLRPAVRDDWVTTARLQWSVTLAEGWTLEGSMLLEDGASDVADMAGREYTRRTFSLSLRTRL